MRSLYHECDIRNARLNCSATLPCGSFSMSSFLRGDRSKYHQALFSIGSRSEILRDFLEIGSSSGSSSSSLEVSIVSDKSVEVSSALLLESKRSEDDAAILMATQGRKDMSTSPSVGRRSATVALHLSVNRWRMTMMPMI